MSDGIEYTKRITVPLIETHKRMVRGSGVLEASAAFRPALLPCSDLTNVASHRTPRNRGQSQRYRVLDTRVIR